jgi:GDP-L-fucose synthase
MDRLGKIYLAGHCGMVGAAIFRRLLALGHSSEAILTRTRRELDLLDQHEVRRFFELYRPSEVYIAAAKVGGIYANSAYPGDFLYQNILIAANIIDSAFRANVKKLIFLGSSCIYPRACSQPIPEEALLTGPLEATNEPYAIAKIAGIKMCESYNRQYGREFGLDYRCLMPCNLYGPGDNYHAEDSHVIPALIRRIHEAKVRKEPKVSIWGTGSARREFLYVDDLAEACVRVANLAKSDFEGLMGGRLSHMNVGFGEDITIRELVEMIRHTVDYSGEIVFDPTKPDGTPRKLMDSTRIRDLGWRPVVGLSRGLQAAYRDFLERQTLQAGIYRG